ncbi:restriction endonuclease subunit S (plasmid) [Cyanobacterium sp. IPPAS B-1200]|uniref:restriction endonuclease subunit S n=1 Tax=Cyanobacterium sp. IPPAS B-1200 TaxID=1562720 RepID=UPI000852821B|nr:restriction endonuclease subunit S [Cyanobacterium sp. IPPAS B-1200]OEJ80019.1 hypothetical protein A5482_07740 [Cyanobacterium sp. IPPAS B-1200]
MSEWQQYQIKDLIKIEKKAYKPNSFDDIPYLGLEHINEKTLSLNSIGSSKDIESNKFFFESEDTLFGKLRPYFRKVYQPKFSGICSTDIWVFRKKSDQIDKNFLFYFVANPLFVDKVSNASTGTRMPRGDWNFIKDTKWYIPPLEEQKAIASVLSCLDEKIENLRKQNETLEAIAQTLFKHWFIDFEFPNEDGKPYKSSGGKMVASELGEIPKGWQVGKLGDEFNILMGQSPAGSSFNENQEGFIFYQGRTDFGFRFPTVRLYTTEPKRIAEKFDVLVSVRAPVGDINVASERCCIGRGLSAVRSNYKSYCLYTLKSYRKTFDIFETEGTVFGSLNKDNFNNLASIIPSNTIIIQFENVTFSLDQKIFLNTNQIQTLTKTRDELLPKLMSGQIRVNE